MRSTVLGVLAVCLCVSVVAYAQDTATKEDAQRLATGQITKIDAKKMLLTVRESAADDSATHDPSANGGRRGGGGMGGDRRGRRGGGTGIPFPGGGGGRYPGSTPTSQGKEFKVTVTDKTAIKDSQSSMSFGMLRIGDRITIQGLPTKGNGPDLNATQITVRP